MLTQEEINDMLERLSRTLRDIGIPISDSICPKVRLSKAHSFFGQCIPKGAHRRFPEGYDFLIALSVFTLGNSYRSIENTLVHELLHTCPGCLNHGPQWKAHAEVVRKRLHLDIKRVHGDKTPSDIANLRAGRKKSPFRYMVYCPNCGASWKYRKAGRVVRYADKCTCACGYVGMKLKNLF